MAPKNDWLAANINNVPVFYEKKSSLLTQFSMASGTVFVLPHLYCWLSTYTKESLLYTNPGHLRLE